MVAKVLWAIVWSGVVITAPLLLLLVLTSYLMAAKLPEKVEVALYLGGIFLFFVLAFVGSSSCGGRSSRIDLPGVQERNFGLAARN